MQKLQFCKSVLDSKVTVPPGEVLKLKVSAEEVKTGGRREPEGSGVEEISSEKELSSPAAFIAVTAKKYVWPPGRSDMRTDGAIVG